jgi:argininosuccinate lyase
MADNLRERFSEPLDSFVRRFVASVRDDAEIVSYDIAGSLAHVEALEAAGLLRPDEARALRDGLERIRAEWESGDFRLAEELEDVHMNVEARLRQIAGPVADKLHTGRSRNDQVALDLRLFVRDACDRIAASCEELADAFDRRGTHDMLPGTTHLQHAQPVTLAMALGAWAAALRRDAARFRDARRRADVSPLGAGALAGTSLGTDPAVAARRLGFAAVFANPIDAVSDRDFTLEFAGACAATMLHLSQWAETWILWMTPEYGFLDLPDALCTGSSLMPQKKNPDVLELVRARSGDVAGQWVRLFTILKGLAPAYNRDLQETKPAVFAAARTTEACLAAARRCVEAAVFRTDRMAAAAADPALRATALAEHLVRRGVPFREAHGAVARLFRRIGASGSVPDSATDLHPALDAEALAVLRGAP